ncbi:MAG: anti-sigma factor [Terriglobia bacterium]
MKPECFEIQDYLPDYLDHRLAETTLQTVRTHLDECEECASFLLGLEYTLSLCQEYVELDPPPKLVGRILKQTSRGYEFLSWKDYVRELFRPLYTTPRFATGLLMVVISMSFVMNALGVNLNSLTLADLAPKTLVEKFDRMINVAYDTGLRRLNDLKILYQIQSKLEEFETPGTEESRKPTKQDKLPAGSSLQENPTSHSLASKQGNSVRGLNLSQDNLL